MSSANKEASGTQLPPPAAERIPTVTAPPGETTPGTAEQAASAAEQAPALQTPPAQSITTIPLPIPPPAAPGQSSSVRNVSLTTQGAVPQIDDDNDLIEKEWVNKAKQIVERNRDDPYKQSEELTVFKADYMKKRYGKTVKISQ